MTPRTWTADDLHRPVSGGGSRLAWTAAIAVSVLVAALLFLSTSPPQPSRSPRDPGLHVRLDVVDLLPGYEVDADRQRLGPARITLADGRTVFVPARTPYSGADPCPALQLPEVGGDPSCTVFLWFDDETASVSWITQLRPGGPGEALLVGRLLSGSDDQLIVDDGTSVRIGAGLRLSECGRADLSDVVGRQVVVSIDDTTGQARQVTCRS